jgi:hypothetical protein
MGAAGWVWVWGGEQVPRGWGEGEGGKEQVLGGWGGGPAFLLAYIHTRKRGVSEEFSIVYFAKDSHPTGTKK